MKLKLTKKGAEVLSLFLQGTLPNTVENNRELNRIRTELASLLNKASATKVPKKLKPLTKKEIKKALTSVMPSTKYTDSKLFLGAIRDKINTTLGN